MNSEALIFLPWLRLHDAVTLDRFLFLPVGGEKGFGDLPEHISKQASLTASSYTDRAGHNVPDFTLVLRDKGESPWNLTDDEFSRVRELSSLLFFCSWSLNDYYSQLGSYSNSSMFNVVGQRFTLDSPEGVALTLRRRDGEILSGGYNHGHVRFVAPPQYAINRESRIDNDLLTAVIAATSQGLRVADILYSVLGLIELANTDRDYISISSEIILMSSALETFFEIDRGAKAVALGDAFSSMLGSYSSLTAEDAIKKGRPVFIDPREGAQPNWSIFKAWVHEFYKLRNEHIHSKKSPTRTWGWHELEHAVMGAFTFPLLVKLALFDAKIYSLSREDQRRLSALGELLITPEWAGSEHPGSFNNTWRKILYSIR